MSQEEHSESFSNCLVDENADKAYLNRNFIKEDLDISLTTK